MNEKPEYDMRLMGLAVLMILVAALSLTVAFVMAMFGIEGWAYFLIVVIIAIGGAYDISARAYASVNKNKED